MFLDENDIIEQSDLFPNFIDSKYLKAYRLYLEALSYLRELLDYDFNLNDYTIAYDFVILKIDKAHIQTTGSHILTHDLEDYDDLDAWLAFKFFDQDGILQYETWEEKMNSSI